MASERLQKLLARAGYGSRRTSERLIVAGNVKVDGVVATLGDRADPDVNQITVDGIVLAKPEPPITFMLNKPVGHLVTARDERGRPTVFDLLPNAPVGLRYVGRLDRDSSGLLLLTTDGELTFRLTHPRYRIVKTYEATLDNIPSDKSIERLRAGIVLSDGMTAPAEVLLIDSDPVRNFARLNISIREGRKRQVRRMLATIGCKVLKLNRISVGGLSLGQLPSGSYRPLTNEEEDDLRQSVLLLDTPSQVSI